MAEESTGSQTSSSGIRAVLDRHLDKITGPLSSDGEMATMSEIVHKLSQLHREDQLRQFRRTQEYEVLKVGEEQDRVEMGLHRARIEDDLRRREDSQATPRQESG